MKTNREFKVARISVFVLLLSLLTAMAYLPRLSSAHDIQVAPFRILIELACVVLFFSIFIVSWHGYGIHRQSRSIVLAVGFLCAAIFNFFSVVSETTAPHFSVPGTYQQSTMLFSLLWRILTALILLFIATESIQKSKLRLTAHWALRTGLAAVSVISLLVFVYFDQIPPLQAAGTWSFQVKTGIETGLIALFLTASALFYTHIRTTTHPVDIAEKSYLFVACAALGLSEFCFSGIHHQYVLQIILGQLYQFVAAYCIYSSLVTINLRAPFAQLANARKEILKSRNRLTGIIKTATDGIITIDSRHNIILVNPAAEKFFGYDDGEMMGMQLDQFIPLRNRLGHSHHVDQFGKTGTTIRQMGVQSADFSVTGLKKNGEEFPIEASISSLTEGDQRFFTVIFRDITDRKIAKQKMEQVHRELSELSQSLQTVREEERKHIARELHDDLGQLLAALRMDLSVLEKRAPDTEAVKPILLSMNSLILNAISTLRRIATNLRPRALDEGGLYFALQTLQKDFQQHHEIDCELAAKEEDLILNDEISTMVYRVIQESLTNVARHAKATRVRIEMNRSGHQLNFKIIDNGLGISEQDLKKRHSFGLVGMRERVRGLQGELTITGDGAHGTCIEVAIPISGISGLN
ncbi:PAS domain S-box-containing protein [Oxalobacteraceae bacterium GrIS 1.18]